VVAMSGGVDSSVCAALLKNQGFEVIGITMQIWQQAKQERGCCGLSSIDDARKVAYKLDIPHYVLNFRDVFKKRIIADFCREYKRGRTPNPCIRCNKYVKFDALLRRARQINADYVATGHYAKIEFNGRKRKYILKKGMDAQKDQSYFLYVMTQGQMRHILMPLGGFTKKKVRQLAKELDLPVADKLESQEICFVPDNNYGKFIKEHFPESVRPGYIINREGKIIGGHQGIIFYTIGQRKGIGIAHKEPLYVSAINRKNDTIVAGNKNEVYSNELIARDVNLIYMKELKSAMRAKVKVRYLHPEADATLIPKNRKCIQIKFKKPQWAITPGQAAVFYLPSRHNKRGEGKNDIVIGGGTISYT